MPFPQRSPGGLAGPFPPPSGPRLATLAPREQRGPSAGASPSTSAAGVPPCRTPGVEPFTAVVSRERVVISTGALPDREFPSANPRPPPHEPLVDSITPRRHEAEDDA